MSKDTPRNAQCPCGSGKKYKHCCLGKPTATEKTRSYTLLAIVLVCIVGGVLLAIFKDIRLGLAVGLGGTFLVMIGASIFKSPPPSSGSDPAGINFGK